MSFLQQVIGLLSFWFKDFPIVRSLLLPVLDPSENNICAIVPRNGTQLGIEALEVDEIIERGEMLAGTDMTPPTRYISCVRSARRAGLSKIICASIVTNKLLRINR